MQTGNCSDWLSVVTLSFFMPPVGGGSGGDSVVSGCVVTDDFSELSGFFF